MGMFDWVTDDPDEATKEYDDDWETLYDHLPQSKDGPCRMEVIYRDAIDPISKGYIINHYYNNEPEGWVDYRRGPDGWTRTVNHDR